MTNDKQYTDNMNPAAPENIGRNRKFVPEIQSKLRADYIKAPEIIRDASGIRLYGSRIKSIIFTTDIAIIANTNADAILAVFPFTPQPSIFEAISNIAVTPFFAGVGGGKTNGKRSAKMATFAEAFGCYGVVLNAPASIETIQLVADEVDCPIISTIISEYMDIESRLRAGVNILNVSASKDTPKVIREIRKTYPTIPIIATGGPTEESIRETIEAGANAITFMPPSNRNIFQETMDRYRATAEIYYENQHKLV